VRANGGILVALCGQIVESFIDRLKPSSALMTPQNFRPHIPGHLQENGLLMFVT
jgi:hypothetical protein